MSLIRHHGGARCALIVLALVAGLVTPALDRMAPAAADPSAEVGSAIDAYQAARARLAATEAVQRDAVAQRAAALEQQASATAALAAADASLADQRNRYAALSAEYFVRQGADDKVANNSMHLALSGRRELLDRAKDVQKAATRDLKDARRALDDREKALASATKDHDAAAGVADETGAKADQAIADTGRGICPPSPTSPTGTPPPEPASPIRRASSRPPCWPAWAGSARATAATRAPPSITSVGSIPRCEASGAVRAADTDQGTIDGDPGSDRAVGPMQLSPATWAAHATDGDGDGTANPDDLFDASATTAEVLCAPGTALDTFVPLDRATRALLGESQQSTVALGTARRYARTTELDMGQVPADPRANAGDGSPQFDTSDTNFAPGDVLGMIDWAMTRLGTPYSQCLGIEARPQDPECPPGTNRFGAGFFDCSGFVSSAYRRIGIAVPATTYAMEADPRFMATQVVGRHRPERDGTGRRVPHGRPHRDVRGRRDDHPRHQRRAHLRAGAGVGGQRHLRRVAPGRAALTDACARRRARRGSAMLSGGVRGSRARRRN